VSELPPIDPGTVPPASPPVEALPWEDPNAGIGSFVPTAGQFIAGPYQAYGKMSLSVDLVRPIAYFVIWVLFGVLVGQLWHYLFWSRESSGLDLIPANVLEQAPWLTKMLDRPTAWTVAVLLVIAPLINLLMLFVWSLIVHLVLVLFGGAASGFTATLRVVCYSQTTAVAVLIPVVGGLIQPIWALVLQIIGLSRAHRVSGGKAALAVLLPLAVCCGCFVLLAAFVILSAGRALNN
jgi:hypothetical protein